MGTPCRLTIVVDGLAAKQTRSLPAGTYMLKVPQGRAKPAPVAQQPTIAEAPHDAQVLAPGEFIYTVKAGDSLSKIAQKFKVSVDAISKIEGQTKTLSEIHPGERLLILKK